MRQPTLCLIHEAIGPYSAIAKVAMSQVRSALDAGWKVTVVAKFLDESLQGEVEWLRLFVPRRLFFVQWVTARYFIKQALGNRQFDVVHAHQPQVASISDVFQCHFLTRAAYERNCLETRPGCRPAAIRIQQHAVLQVEDWFYRNWNARTRMLYGSAFTRNEFHRLYGKLPREDILLCPSPPFSPSTEDERFTARRELVSNVNKPVLGFLGGVDERKGYRRVLDALRAEADIYLLMGGIHSHGFHVDLPGGMRSLGLVEDTRHFYAACDVLIVPSLFEPFGLVALEAAAQGVPIIATDEVGALPHLLEYGVALRWNPAEPLGPVVRAAISRKTAIQHGARRLAADLSAERQQQELIGLYESVAEENRSWRTPVPTHR